MLKVRSLGARGSSSVTPDRDSFHKKVLYGLFIVYLFQIEILVFSIIQFETELDSDSVEKMKEVVWGCLRHCYFSHEELRVIES